MNSFQNIRQIAELILDETNINSDSDKSDYYEDMESSTSTDTDDDLSTYNYSTGDEDNSESLDTTNSSESNSEIHEIDLVEIDRNSDTTDSIDNIQDGHDSYFDDDITIKNVPLEQPTLLHVYDKTPYYYLPEYTKSIQIIEEINYIDFDIHTHLICNNTYKDPYMISFLEYDTIGKFYRFPRIKYTVYSDTNKNDHAGLIRDKCFEFLFPIFGIEPDTIDDENIISQCMNAFEGFHYDSGKNEGIVGINIEPFLAFLNKKSESSTLSTYFYDYERIDDTIPRYIWVGIYEMIHLKYTYNIPIEPNTVQSFVKNPWMHIIVNDEYEATYIPKVLFEESSNKDRTIHHDHGNVYLFSNKLPSNMFKTPRFVVFPNVQSEINGVEFYGAFTRNVFKEF